MNHLHLLGFNAIIFLSVLSFSAKVKVKEPGLHASSAQLSVRKPQDHGKIKKFYSKVLSPDYYTNFLKMLMVPSGLFPQAPLKVIVVVAIVDQWEEKSLFFFFLLEVGYRPTFQRNSEEKPSSQQGRFSGGEAGWRLFNKLV